MITVSVIFWTNRGTNHLQDGAKTNACILNIFICRCCYNMFVLAAFFRTIEKLNLLTSIFDWDYQS